MCFIVLSNSNMMERFWEKQLNFWKIFDSFEKLKNFCGKFQRNFQFFTAIFQPRIFSSTSLIFTICFLTRIFHVTSIFWPRIFSPTRTIGALIVKTTIVNFSYFEIYKVKYFSKISEIFFGISRNTSRKYPKYFSKTFEILPYNFWNYFWNFAM